LQEKAKTYVLSVKRFHRFFQFGGCVN
jgi:hypothetical protein